jgi:hypothetical protein
MSDGDYVDTKDPWNQAAFFAIGLFGILGTGAIVGVGDDNYWGVGHIDPPFVPQRTTAILGVLVFLVGLSDLVALGVILAGAVIVVQRLRGVPGED